MSSRYQPTPHTSQHWEIRKPAARGGGGMVVSQVKVAAEAGAAMLAAGGTAADAIVAPAFALATLEPWNSGLGVIGFAQVDAEERITHAAVADGDMGAGHVDARGVAAEIAAPTAVDVEALEGDAGGADAHDGAVPGAT